MIRYDKIWYVMKCAWNMNEIENEWEKMSVNTIKTMVQCIYDNHHLPHHISLYPEPIAVPIYIFQCEIAIYLIYKWYDDIHNFTKLDLQNNNLEQII